MLRKPAVAGYFYQASPSKLAEQVSKYVEPGLQKTRALGVVAPHAGFTYSGAVAGAVYSRIIPADTFILIGPNHTGLGPAVSVFPDGQWEMPNGDIAIDKEIADLIVAGSRHASKDYNAHVGEHSLEVQIPFIQHFTKNFRIVPVTMMSSTLEVCRELGHAISLAIQETSRNALIVASSDMTHYESAGSAKEKDDMAIEKVLALNPAGLHATVKEHGITMCGFAPAVTMLYATTELGASKAALVKYMNSGDMSGDYEQVVGYAGIIIS